MNRNRWLLLGLFALLVVFPAHAQGIIDTVAGGFSPDGHPGLDIPVAQPPTVAVDSAGNVYFPSDNRVLKLGTDGLISVVAGTEFRGYDGDGGPATSAKFSRPAGVAVDSSGNVYISDSGNHRVRKVDASGIVSNFAGSGFGFSGDGGPATSARLSYPRGLVVDGAGNVFISDAYNYRIRKVDAAGIITTVAGTGGWGGYSGDGGPATSASISWVPNLAIDGAGNLYLADLNNQRVRRVDTSGIIATVAGNGSRGFSGDGGPATGASLSNPGGVSTDGTGNLYVADPGNNRIRKIDASGIITTVAGDGSSGFAGDGGPATNASFDSPGSVSTNSAGDLLIADTYNLRIREVDSAGIIATIAGNGTYGFFGDGGPAIGAGLAEPYGVAFDDAGNLYIADITNGRIRRVDATGTITTVAGNGTFDFGGDGGPATEAAFHDPAGLEVDNAGNLYIADYHNQRVRMVDAAGIITTVAGDGTFGFGGDGGQATSAWFRSPTDMVVDGDGNLYIADHRNHRVRKVDTSGIITTVAGSGTRGFSGDGGPATSASLNSPHFVALDADGNLYLADMYNHRIRKVDSAAIITTVAGTGVNGFSGDGGPATSASLSYPYGIVVDDDGNLFIGDDGNLRVRMVDTSGIITTIAGNGDYGFSGDGGPATGASFGGTTDLALGGVGHLYIADQANNRIRRVRLDFDLDGVPNDTDNCISEPNSLQVNVDGDSQGDLCDPCPAIAEDTCNPAGSAAEEISADDGGTVANDDGTITLDVESGDLEADATLSVTEAEVDDTTADLVVGADPGLGETVGSWILEPDGIDFQNSISLTVVVDATPLTPEQRDQLDLYISHDTDSDGTDDIYEALNAACGVSEDPPAVFTATCTAELTHFSVYAIIAPSDSDGDGIFDLFGGIEDVCPDEPNVIEGFLSPMTDLVPDGEETVLPDRAFKSNRTLPMKLDYYCGTVPLADEDGITPPELVEVWRVGDAEPLPLIDPDEGAGDDTGIWFRYSGEHWIYNYSTKGLGAGTYEVKVKVPCGRIFKGGFVLR